MDRRRLLLVVAAVIAALGVAVVFVYARGAESRAAEQYDTVSVLTVNAGQSILPGESLESASNAGKIVPRDVPQNQVLEGAILESDSDGFDALEGQVALTTLYGGEQLVPTKFGGVGDSLDAVQLPIPNGMLAKFEQFDLPVGTFILPGSEVAVFYAVPGLPACLLIDRVPVIAVGESTSGEEEESEEDSSSDDEAPPLTLAVTQKQFEVIESAKATGELTVGLLNAESDVRARTGSCVGNLAAAGE